MKISELIKFLNRVDDDLDITFTIYDKEFLPTNIKEPSFIMLEKIHGKYNITLNISLIVE